MEQVVLEKLIEKAKSAAERAYCPNSENPVGACVLTQNGMIFTGCNIETTAPAGSLGAMEVAVVKAVSEGCSNILAVVNYCENSIVYPTGDEREFLREFTERAQIICATVDKTEQFTIQELLPFSFRE